MHIFRVRSLPKSTKNRWKIAFEKKLAKKPPKNRFWDHLGTKSIKVTFLKDIQTLILELIINQFWPTRWQKKRMNRALIFLKFPFFCFQGMESRQKLGYFSLMNYLLWIHVIDSICIWNRCLLSRILTKWITTVKNLESCFSGDHNFCSENIRIVFFYVFCPNGSD